MAEVKTNKAAARIDAAEKCFGECYRKMLWDSHLPASKIIELEKTLKTRRKEPVTQEQLLNYDKIVADAITHKADVYKTSIENSTNRRSTIKKKDLDTPENDEACDEELYQTKQELMRLKEELLKLKQEGAISEEMMQVKLELSQVKQELQQLKQEAKERVDMDTIRDKIALMKERMYATQDACILIREAVVTASLEKIKNFNKDSLT